ncbi:MAG TPA: tetratricopeptide repeat protein, partial [Lacunisphaera sp.]|nr:tetratricopeptide repeat protein [Lacunisphaera sp.]
VLKAMSRFLFLLLLGVLPALADDGTAREKITALLQQRQWPEAQALLEQLTASEPANAQAWSSLSEVYLARGDHEKAVLAAEKATGLDAAQSSYFLQLGHSYGSSAGKAGLFAKLGFARKCKAAYDRAVELDPANINARWSLMEFCRQAPAMVGGGLPLAYAQAEEIRKLDPRRGRAALASLYSAEKKYANAFAVYDEVLREKPDDDDALFQIGRLAARSGEQLDRGLANLRRLVAREGRPPDAQSHTLIGNILEKQGDRSGAQAAYETALAINPQFPPAVEALRRLNAG